MRSKYKKGDIVICVTNKMYGMTYLLEVGKQYQIDDCIEMSEKNLLSVYYETDYVFLMINTLYH